MLTLQGQAWIKEAADSQAGEDGLEIGGQDLVEAIREHLKLRVWDSEVGRVRVTIEWETWNGR